MKDKKDNANALRSGSIISSVSSGFSSLFAILGGVCCWGPLFFSILGVGASGGGALGATASFFGFIAPYRNYFLLLNIIGLVMSFYFIYLYPYYARAKGFGKEPAAIGCETCDPAVSRSFILNKIIFFISLLITIGIFLYLYIDTGQIFTSWFPI
ncbi:MAG: hypothetical protein M0016_03510 [Deltaproteobacteria bacterium]|jgi:hypothetical protein|nr:hypothetical protein [Deltaproteobacteria bacterium]MCL5880747.1 hypothetical protein [Deltaproteobacteria bacterium]MDA8304213.1 hypothetical protein [Deltaproteobacteria bacterium]